MVTWRARHRGRAGLEVETQRHSQVAQETSAAKDVTPVVATAADTKKANITNPKCSPVSATTTAIGTRGVMPKEVSFFSLIRRTGDARRFPPPWTRAMKRGRHATDRAKEDPLSARCDGNAQRCRRAWLPPSLQADRRPALVVSPAVRE